MGEDPFQPPTLPEADEDPTAEPDEFPPAEPPPAEPPEEPERVPPEPAPGFDSPASPTTR